LPYIGPDAVRIASADSNSHGAGTSALAPYAKLGNSE
jgi:hypothetical protein